MFKYKINIIELETLYTVLSEIKDNFSFDLKYFKSISDFIDDYNTNKKSNNFLIIIDFKIKDKLSQIKKINLNNDVIFFVKKGHRINNEEKYNFVETPLNLNNFIEKINIQSIKKKYQEQSNIKLLNYELDVNSRKLFNKVDNLKLTEREIDIILYLKNSKNPKTVADLQKMVWGYSSSLETHTVETHIHRLRKKIKEIFNDDNFIINEGHGYKIK